MEQVLDRGAIVQAGKYEDLLQADTNFQKLVNAHNEAINGMESHGHSPGAQFFNLFPNYYVQIAMRSNFLTTVY